MDRRSILSKTAQGFAEATGKTSQLSRALRNILKEIDGRASIADLTEKFPRIPEAELLETMKALEQEGFLRELPRTGTAAPAGAAKRGAAQKNTPDGGEDLDFTAIAAPPVAQPPDDSAARQAAAARAEAEAAARARAEGEAAARAQAEAEAAAKAKADAEAAAKAEARRAQAAALVRAHQEARAKQAAEATAKAEAEAAELRHRLEEERKAREELELKAKEDAERAVREAEERTRREVDERVRKEIEERVKREAAERARRETELREAKQRLEAEESARRQAVEQARREADDLRAKLDEAERKAREDAERRAREEAQHRPPEKTDFPILEIPEPAVDEAQLERAAEEQASELSRRFQEEQAKRTAERQAQRQEAERERAAEEAAAEEAKQKVLREQEELRRAMEEAERRRVEEEARASAEAEARAREAEEVRARVAEEARALADTAMRAREQAGDEQPAARPQRREIPTGAREAEPAPRTPRRARRRARVAALLFLLLIGAFAAVYFMPLDAASFEREATVRFGTPVKIGSAHLSLLPMPALRFERVTIGPAGDVKIATVATPAGAGAIFDRQKALRTLELDGVQIPASWLGAAIWGKGTGEAFRVERVIARGVRVEAPGLELPAFNVEATLDSGGALQSLSAATADKQQTFNLTMTDGKAAVEISARPFRLPFPGAVQLDDLVGGGTLTPTELTLSKFELGAFGGSVKGNARVRWGASWSVEGEFIAASMDPRLVTASLVPTGRLEGKGTVSMRAATPDKLQEATRLDATFTVKNGSLGFVDLTRALQGGNARGGTTSFTSLDGNLSFGSGNVRLTQLRLAAGLLNATGEATVDPRKNLNGRLQVDLTSQARGVLTLGGTVTAPQVKR